MDKIKEQLKELEAQIEMHKNLSKKKYFVRFFDFGAGKFVTRSLKIRDENKEKNKIG